MPKENRYILVEKLARGGMAEIYLGRLAAEDGFKRVCCIKRILPHYSHEKEYIEMFRDEAHICKRLQHANIVRVEGFEEVDGSYAIIMEYVDGADLRKILASCENAGIAIPIPIALYITAEIARGLHYAHTKIDDITRKPLSIVHRDISPQNILVSFEGEAKVTDFGIADAENKSTETKPGIVKGKYSYMSPEQIMAKNVDARTDVFALAIVLWEMVAMERLFLFENDVITIQKVKNCEIKRLPRGVKRPKSEIDDELEAIILSGLQKDLKKRYPDAKAFEGALRKYLSKRYPSFVPTELSVFLKNLLSEEKEKSSAAIKKALTAVDISSNNSQVQLKIQGQNESSINRNVSFNISKEDANQEFSLARSARVHSSMMRKRGSLSSTPALSKLRKPAANIQPSTGMKAHRSMARQPKTSNTKFLLQIATALISIALISMAAKHYYQSKKSPASFIVNSVPSNVKLILDGKVLNDDRYIQTPYKSKITQGTHELIVRRDGFVDKRVKLDIKSNTRTEKILAALEKKSTNFAPVDIKIADPSIKEVWIDLEMGMEVGLAPRKVNDLLAGKLHTAKIYPNYPSKKNRFTCSFKPRARSWKAPFVVMIYPKAKRCAYSVP